MTTQKEHECNYKMKTYGNKWNKLQFSTIRVFSSLLPSSFHLFVSFASLKTKEEQFVIVVTMSSLRVIAMEGKTKREKVMAGEGVVRRRRTEHDIGSP